MRHIFSIKLEKFVPHFQETSRWRFVNLWHPLVLSIQLSFLLLFCFFHFEELLLFNLCWFISICFSLDGNVKKKNQYYCCDVRLYVNDGSHNLFLFYVHFYVHLFFPLQHLWEPLTAKNIYSTWLVPPIFIFWWQ